MWPTSGSRADACYLIARNGDPSKDPIALAQAIMRTRLKKESSMSGDPGRVGKPQAAKPAVVKEPSVCRLEFMEIGFRPATEAGRAAIAAIALSQITSLLLVARIFPFLSNSGNREAADFIFEMGTFGLAAGLLALAGFAAFIGWQYQAHRNLLALGNRDSVLGARLERVVVAHRAGRRAPGRVSSRSANLAWQPAGRIPGHHPGSWGFFWRLFRVLSCRIRCCGKSGDVAILCRSQGTVSSSEPERLIAWWGCYLAGTFLYAVTRLGGELVAGLPTAILLSLAAITGILQSMLICDFILEVNAMQGKRFTRLGEMAAESDDPVPDSAAAGPGGTESESLRQRR